MLNISKKIFTGWDSTKQKELLPEAEVIPGGSTAPEKKRVEKLKTKHTDVKEHDNIPLPGFTLYDQNRKNWGSADITWLVIDPRGFLVRISSENLNDILKVTGITEGLIQEKCVWAREDAKAQLTLIPVSSKLYEEATNNTEILEDKVSISDVNIGDTVLLQNKLHGTYLGVLSLYGTLQQSSAGPYAIQSFLRRQVVEIEPGKFHCQTNVKILKVIKKADKISTREESAKYINEAIATGNSLFTAGTNFSHGYFGSHGVVKYVSTRAVTDVGLRAEEITEYEATQIFHDSQSLSETGVLLLENSKGEKSIVDQGYLWYSGTQASITSFGVLEIESITENKINLTESAKNHSYFARTDAARHSLDKFTKFYKIVKSVKNETYI